MKITSITKISNHNLIKLMALDKCEEAIKIQLQYSIVKKLTDCLSYEKKLIYEMGEIEYKMEFILFDLSTASKIFALLNEEHLSVELMKELKEIFIEKI
jgi:hypothetical protein